MRQKVKKIILMLTFICISLFSYNSTYVYGSTSSNVLGTASDFSIFVLNDHIHKNSDVTGRAAVGNNATYENYSIGNSLEKSTTRSDLIVGNTLNAIGGSNFNGNTSIGTKGKVSNYTMTNNNKVSDQPKKEDIINFSNEKSYLYATTKKLSSLEVNGNVSNYYGQLNLKGSDKNLVVFNVSNENLNGINGINIDVPESATVIINILGKKVEIGNLSIFYKMNTPSGDVFKKWLWNFPQTEKLNFYGISVKGSILAPYATFDANGSGNIEGTIILNNFYNNNAGFEVHNYPFTGSVPSDNKNGTTPTTDKEETKGETISDSNTKNSTKPEEKSTETTSDNTVKPNETSSKTEEDTNVNKETDKEITPVTNEVKDSDESKKTISEGPKTGDATSVAVIFSLLGTSVISLTLLRKFR